MTFIEAGRRQGRTGRGWMPVRMLLLSIVATAAPAAAEGQGPYQPSWPSLARHETPQWLQDAKFGIYAHWGVYAVPGFETEHYAKRMYEEGHPVHEHHVKTWGDPAEFGYREFIPMFRAEHFDPDDWADLVRSSGARYAGLAVLHHDGFLLWDSDVNRWNAGNMGPKRDLYGELVQAFRARGLKTIATFHHIRTFNWYLPGTSGLADVQDRQKAERARQKGYDIFDPAYSDLYWNEYTGRFEDFVAEWNAKVREVIDKYDPDVLWFDGGHFQKRGAEQTVQDLLAYYHNQGLARGKQVEVLNKLPGNMVFNFPPNYGVLTFEEGRDRPEIVGRPWIDDQRISNDAWGYLHDQTYKTTDEILDGLIDRVSRGGGLLLSLSPKADGTIPEPQRRILREMGAWLSQNGEAIYETRPWIVNAEGPTDKLIIPGTERWTFTNTDAGDIRFTTRGNTLYAIALGWPEDRRITIRSLATQAPVATGEIRQVRLLGSSEAVTWSRTPEGLELRLPAIRPNDFAYTFRIDVDGELIR